MHSSVALSVTALLALVATAAGHGVLTQPRQRGSLNTQRDIPDPIMDPSAPIDYCPHCLNCGGVGSVAKGGPWKIFAPFDYARGGITLCGDPVGTDDHTRKGKFANPASMPYVATYAPGSIANFEYDITAHHNGYISFYLCDVSATGDVVNTLEYFKSHCHELERSPHPDCEAGTAKDCGPIDPKFPGRWVLPCKSGAPDQVFGGPNGKMAYKIPNVDIPDAVVIAYWLTQNTCNSPDGFMDDYKYPSVWAGCPGDGGVMGGHPKFKDCTTTGQIPEEFFSCGDVQITGGSGGSTPAPRKVSPVAGTDAPKTSGAESAKATPEATPNAAGGKGNATSYAYNGGKTKMTAETATTPPPVTPVECNKQAPALLQPTNSEETCSGHWRQCGGKGWSGTTKCCDDKYTCVSVNDSYSQCLTQA